MPEVIFETTENVVEKPYTFKRLNAGDIAPMCKVIRKFGINEFVNCFQSEGVQNLVAKLKKDKAANIEDIAGVQVIVEIANVIISHIPDCETEIFTFLSGVTGLKVAEIKEFELATFAEMIIDFLKKEELGDFFKVVSKLLN